MCRLRQRDLLAQWQRNFSIGLNVKKCNGGSSAIKFLNAAYEPRILFSERKIDRIDKNMFNNTRKRRRSCILYRFFPRSFLLTDHVFPRFFNARALARFYFHASRFVIYIYLIQNRPPRITDLSQKPFRVLAACFQVFSSIPLEKNVISVHSIVLRLEIIQRRF